MTDDYTVIGRNLFKKETNLQLFVGLKVTLSTGESGVIEGGFGQSGKFRIRVQGKDYLRWEVIASSPLSHRCSNYWYCLSSLESHISNSLWRLIMLHRQVSLFINTHVQSTFSVFSWTLGLCGQFSGCGKSGRPDILSHIPRIPLGVACVPGEVCSVYFTFCCSEPTAPHQEGRENKNIWKENLTYILFTASHLHAQKSQTY